MKLLLYDLGSYTQSDMMQALGDMGISFQSIMYHLKDVYEDAYFTKRVNELLEINDFDAVLSVNYFPVLAKVCAQRGISYLSWSYDSPLNIEKIEDTLGYRTNYVFFFDRIECEKYWKKGYENVYHLPLAVNTERLDHVQISTEDIKKYSADISMVGQLYDTSLPVLMMPLDDYEKGYLAASIEAQLRLYGCYILPELISEELVDKINQKYEELGQTSVRLNRESLIVTMAKYITHTERLLLLDVLSDICQVHLYGPDRDESLSRVNYHGSADYFEEMPLVFKLSRINLNISLKCIQSGIPLRALDIMGCGGFLLTNYQPEIAEYFIDGEELVMYTSLEDAVAKCAYYLEHDEERRQIAERGRQKVRQLFGYQDRIRTILQTAGFPV